jgi:hypothetical protein
MVRAHRRRNFGRPLEQIERSFRAKLYRAPRRARQGVRAAAAAAVGRVCLSRTWLGELRSIRPIPTARTNTGRGLRLGARRECLDRLLIFGALLRAGGLTDFTGPSWGKNRAGARGR